MTFGLNKSVLSKFWIFFLFLLLSFTQSSSLCVHGTQLFRANSINARQILHSEGEINAFPCALTDTITWKLLNQLEYKEEKHDAYGVVMMPVFSKNVLAYHKKKVIIKGYILPVDRKSYALSKNVYASCFFCGKAGPETIIGLNFPSAPGRIKMDTYATITGTLIVNGTNVEDWMYSLQDVEILYMKE